MVDLVAVNTINPLINRSGPEVPGTIAEQRKHLEAGAKEPQAQQEGSIDRWSNAAVQGRDRTPAIPTQSELSLPTARPSLHLRESFCGAELLDGISGGGSRAPADHAIRAANPEVSPRRPESAARHYGWISPLPIHGTEDENQLPRRGVLNRHAFLPQSNPRVSIAINNDLVDAGSRREAN